MNLGRRKGAGERKWRRSFDWMEDEGEIGSRTVEGQQEEMAKGGCSGHGEQEREERERGKIRRSITD